MAPDAVRLVINTPLLMPTRIFYESCLWTLERTLCVKCAVLTFVHWEQVSSSALGAHQFLLTKPHIARCSSRNCAEGNSHCALYFQLRLTWHEAGVKHSHFPTMFVSPVLTIWHLLCCPTDLPLSNSTGRFFHGVSTC